MAEEVIHEEGEPEDKVQEGTIQPDTRRGIRGRTRVVQDQVPRQMKEYRGCRSNVSRVKEEQPGRIQKTKDPVGRD